MRERGETCGADAHVQTEPDHIGARPKTGFVKPEPGLEDEAGASL